MRKYKTGKQVKKKKKSIKKISTLRWGGNIIMLCVCVFSIHAKAFKQVEAAHTSTSAATTIANNLDSCIVVAFECDTTIVYYMLYCVVWVQFLWMWQRNREIEREQNLVLKWPIHLQCPCFIVSESFQWILELNVCVSYLFICTRPNKNLRTSSIV